MVPLEGVAQPIVESLVVTVVLEVHRVLSMQVAWQAIRLQMFCPPTRAMMLVQAKEILLRRAEQQARVVMQVMVVQGCLAEVSVVPVVRVALAVQHRAPS
jgi:hypothetical protein